MVYKLLDEDGSYQDKTTKERKNLMEAEFAWTPDGLNVGWDAFDSLEEAMEYFNIQPFVTSGEVI